MVGSLTEPHVSPKKRGKTFVGLGKPTKHVDESLILGLSDPSSILGISTHNYKIINILYLGIEVLYLGRINKIKPGYKMPRKQYSHHYIYKTTCLITNKYYIGMHSTSNLNDGYCGSGKILWYSIQKYGKHNHVTEIIERCLDRKTLVSREIEIVNSALLTDPLCMNIKLGGDGGWLPLSKELQTKVSSLGGRTTNPEKSRKASEKMRESNRKMMEQGTHRTPNRTGTHHRPEIRKLIGTKNSIKQSGSGNSQFDTRWISNEFESIKVKNENLQTYLNNGYQMGRKKKVVKSESDLAIEKAYKIARQHPEDPGLWPSYTQMTMMGPGCSGTSGTSMLMNK